MKFDSFAAFVAMGGHGPYVWACYGVFFVFLAAIMIWSVQSRKAAIEACRRVHEPRGAESSDKVSRTSATFTRVNVSKD